MPRMDEQGTVVADMTADELRHISRKLTTYADIYTGDKEARQMARRCHEVAGLLDAANKLVDAHHQRQDDGDNGDFLAVEGPINDS